MSLDTPDIARGRKYAVVVVDEAATVRELHDAWQHVIRPTLTDLKGNALVSVHAAGHEPFQNPVRLRTGPDAGGLGKLANAHQGESVH